MSDPAADISLILARLDNLAQMVQGRYVSPWLTTREAAAFLRCSVSKVEQLTNVGLLPFQRLDPTSRKSPRLYHRKHLTAYLVTGRNSVKQRLSAEEKRQIQELL